MTCEQGHALRKGQAFCPLCGAPRAAESADDRAADTPRTGSRKRSLIAAAALGLVVATTATALALRDADNPGGNSGDGPLTPGLECPGGTTLPMGTDLLNVSLEENTSERLLIAGTFDGEVPNAELANGTDDYTLSIDFFLLPQSATDENAYSFFVNTLSGRYSVQARRASGGFIDSGGVDLIVEGNRIALSIDPAAFDELDPGTPMRIGAQTLVTFYPGSPVDGPSSETLGSESCPVEGESAPTTAASSPSPAQSTDVGPSSPADQCVEQCTFTIDDVQRDLSNILCQSQDPWTSLRDDITALPVNAGVGADRAIVCSGGGSADLSGYGIVFLWNDSGSVSQESLRDHLCDLGGVAVFGSSPGNPAYAVAGIKSPSSVIDALKEGGASLLCP